VNLTAGILALNFRVADVKSFSCGRDFPEWEIGTKMGKVKKRLCRERAGFSLKGKS
jgi:hypothetical protein